MPKHILPEPHYLIPFKRWEKEYRENLLILYDELSSIGEFFDNIGYIDFCKYMYNSSSTHKLSF